MLLTDRLSLTEYLTGAFECACGKDHASDMKHACICAGAIDRIPEYFEELGWRAAFLVEDTITRGVAGDDIALRLEARGIGIVRCTLALPLIPDEKALGTLLAAFDPKCDAVLAVGSGTINDLCKVVALKCGRPMVIAATAPSMDGFASKVSALTLGDLKVTMDVPAPQAFFGDLDVIRQAPQRMIAAGFGDIAGKIVSLTDWKLSHIINGEPHCPAIEAIIRRALRAVTDNAQAIAQRRDEALVYLLEALLLSGIAMAYAGDSRAASGSEHHLSHFWELRAHAQGKEAALHGLQVGVGAVIAARLYGMFMDSDVDFEAALARSERFDRDAWRASIGRVYGPAAPGVIALEARAQKNAPQSHKRRMLALRENYARVRALIGDMMVGAQEVEALLLAAGAPARPEEIGVLPRDVGEAVLYAKELRDHYTLLQLLWDTGLIEPFSRRAAEQAQEKRRGGADQDRRRLEGIRAFVLDMDGTIYLGNRLFPYTLGFLERAARAGKQVYFYTNNSSKNARAYIEKLAGMGIDIAPGHMMISNEVIIAHILEQYPGKRVFVVGTEYLIDDFERAGIPLAREEAELVVLGFDTTLDYDKLRLACDLVRGGAPILGVNPDFNCPVEGGFIPDCGSIARLIEASTGAQIPFFGKPSAHTLRYILERTGVEPQELAFVGDRLYTDVAIAQGSGALSVLVLSGETREEDVAHSEFRPDIVVDSLEALTKIIV